MGWPTCARLTPAITVLLATFAAASAQAGVIRDGPARFEVITPSLIRLEYSADRRFERRRTLTTAGRVARDPRFSTSVRGGARVIRTSRLVLRWRRDSGPFGGSGLRVRIGRRAVRPALGPNPDPLGGWLRSLDLLDAPIPLHEGVLSRAGWYLLDDSETALITGPRSYAERPEREGAYRDLYLFAYGRNLARGLRDLRVLTGAAPLLPRKSFGVWFSRWWPYGAGDWREIAQRFRSERVPLDVISLDTDFKRVNDPVGAAIAASVVGAPGTPYSWNGWDWNRDLYPDPGAFLRWAERTGLEVGLNVHPSIDDRDPRFAETQAAAGGSLVADPGCRVVQADTLGQCMVFDWADPRQLRAYMALHGPFERDGADFWWLDWCCDGSRALADGLTPDTWINKQYFHRQRARGSRWPAFSRIGGSLQAGFGGRVGNGALAEHRYTLQFTGDTCSTWELLAFVAEYTSAAASIGMPYVSHDIGSFHGDSPVDDCSQLSPYVSGGANKLPDEMYVRWVQLGSLQPFDRLHSHHGQRLPWDYSGRAGEIARRFLRLRGAIVPYLYTLARNAHDTGMPIAWPLYLRWPRRAAAYEHPTQYLLGRDLLVAPVTSAGDPATVEVWFPPGRWVDWFTGRRYRGPVNKQLSVPLERLPLFVRAGAILPTLPYRPTTPPGSLRKVILLAQRGQGRFTLYDDSGDGLAYERGRYTRTRISQRRSGGMTRLRIEAARGSFRSEARRRAWVIRLRGVQRPKRVTVAGRRSRRWSYDRRLRTVTVRTSRLPTARPALITID